MSQFNGSDKSSVEDELAAEGKRVQEWVEKIQAMPDPATRRMLQSCLEAVLGFYGHGLSRILQIIEETGGEGGQVRSALLRDTGVTGLLLIHGLHPIPLEIRLGDALDKVRPYMKSHGGDVELLSLEDDFARLRLKGHCETCPSSTVTLELAVRHAIEEACPDLAGFEVEGMTKSEANSGSAQFEHSPNEAPRWFEVQTAGELVDEQLMVIHEGNEPLILCKTGGQFYAYYDRCPVCNMPLHLGNLKAGSLTCQLHHRYDVQHAGRGLDGNSLHLEPLPLLVQNGIVKIVLPSAKKSEAPVET
jgi:Fe-S cluster biogenesis protein NfuA/nitrite reductase/ring-hydroxylating ferredoxin subunit